MNKYILYTLVIPISFLIGKILLIKHTERKNFFFEFNIFIKNIENEVSFSLGSIKETLTLQDKNTYFYKVMVNKLFNNNGVKIKYLTKNEQSFIDNFCFNLGKTDRITQLKFIEHSKKQIEDYLDKATNLEKRNNKLYFKLSILIGILIYILII